MCPAYDRHDGEGRAEEHREGSDGRGDGQPAGDITPLVGGFINGIARVVIDISVNSCGIVIIGILANVVEGLSKNNPACVHLCARSASILGRYLAFSAHSSK